MPFNEDILIKSPVHFLKKKTVLYIDGRTGATHSYIGDNSEELAYHFRRAGYRFLFLPDLVSSLFPEMLNYQFPGQDETILVENLYQNIQNLVGGMDGKSGFLYKQDGLTYFRVIPESPDSDVKAAVNEFIHFLHRPVVTKPGGTLFREKKKSRDEPLISFSMRESDVEDTLGYASFPEPEADDEVLFRVSADEEPLDPRTEAIIDAWQQIERKFGITIDDLDVILSYRIKLSRMTITTSNRIFLPDIKGKPEVKLDDLTKALYFFYLRHPAGATFKELQDYEDEIYRIYMGITGRDDLEGIRRSVAALVAPYSDGRNSCVSRIKKAFRDIVGDRIAKFYYIDGRYADTRIVRIDRDLVIWEH